MEPLEEEKLRSRTTDSLEASQFLVIPSIEHFQRLEVADDILQPPAGEEESSGSEYDGDAVKIGDGYGDDVDQDVVRAAGGLEDHGVMIKGDTVDIDIPSEDYFEYQFDPAHFPNL
jgi:hypothetical protein